VTIVNIALSDTFLWKSALYFLILVSICFCLSLFFRVIFSAQMYAG
jgi:hypothetical protein